VADGLSGFFSCDQDDFAWNIFDTFIVSLGVVDTVLEVTQILTSSSTGDAFVNFSVLRVLRVVRVVRVIRIIRVMRFFRELRMMVYSTLGSAKSLVWISIIFGIIFYIFGIAFTSAAVGFLSSNEMWNDPKYQDLVEYFGNVQSAVLSLYQSVSGGDDWSMIYNALALTGGPEKYLFLLYITFTCFAVVNVVTGIFVDTAVQVGREDREVMVHEELETRKHNLNTLTELFDAMDEDDSGQMSRTEFLQVMGQEKVNAFFKALKLDTRSTNKLFDLLDKDGSGEIDIDEFIGGCTDLMGEPSAMDAKIMHREVSFIKEWMVAMSKDVQSLKEILQQQVSSHSLSVSKACRDA